MTIRIDTSLGKPEPLTKDEILIVLGVCAYTIGKSIDGLGIEDKEVADKLVQRMFSTLNMMANINGFSFSQATAALDKYNNHNVTIQGSHDSIVIELTEIETEEEEKPADGVS